MSKRITATIVILLVCGIISGAFIYMYSTREKEHFAQKTFSFKEIGININAAKYFAVIDLFGDRLLITFQDIFFHEEELDHFMYLYNFTTNKTTNLTRIINGIVGYAALCGDIVIWMEERPENVSNELTVDLPERSICGYDLKTNKKSVIYSGEGNRRPLGEYKISDEWVTWISMESDDGVSWQNPEAYLYNLKTRETYLLPEGHCIGMYGNDAICNAESSVYSYNTNTGKISRIIEDPALENSTVMFSGSRLIYNISSTLYCYDLATEKKDIITENYSYVPLIQEEDKICWVDHEEKNNTVKDIFYMYNLNTRQKTEIWEKSGEKPEGLSEFSFVALGDIYDNRVVWIGRGFNPDTKLLYWTDLYYLEL